MKAMEELLILRDKNSQLSCRWQVLGSARERVGGRRARLPGSQEARPPLPKCFRGVGWPGRRWVVLAMQELLWQILLDKRMQKLLAEGPGSAFRSALTCRHRGIALKNAFAGMFRGSCLGAWRGRVRFPACFSSQEEAAAEAKLKAVRTKRRLGIQSDVN